MNGKSLILLVVALGCGLVASVGVFQYMDRTHGEEAAMVTVMIAATDIDIKEGFTAENTRRAEWPRARVPFGAVGTLEDLNDKYARTRLYAGEPILRSKTMGLNESAGSLKVPAGFRVVSVKVTSESSVSSLIEPGDRVDVIAILRKSHENPTAIAKTILTAVRVFAVNSDMERTAEAAAADRPEQARTISLLVTPPQAERMMMAGAAGTIQLSLRGQDDTDVEDTPGATLDSVVGEAEAADEFNGPPPQHANPADGRPSAAHSNRLAQANAQTWKMTILSAGDIKQFVWNGASDLPSEAVVEPIEDDGSEVVPVDDAGNALGDDTIFSGLEGFSDEG